MPRQGPNEPNRVLKRSFVAILDWFNTDLLEKVLIIFRSSVFDKIWSRNWSVVLTAWPVSGFTAYCPLNIDSLNSSHNLHPTLLFIETLLLIRNASFCLLFFYQLYKQ